MDEDLIYCFNLAAIYSGILFIIATSTNIKLFTPILNINIFLIIPNTPAQIIGIPFFVMGLARILFKKPVGGFEPPTSS